MSYRFYPLADDISSGVLTREGRRGPVPRSVAVFLTPQQAKAIQQRKALAK